MKSVVALFLAAALAAALWRYLVAQPHGKGKDRRELADALLFLVRLMENGGQLRAHLVDEDIRLCFKRIAGDDRSAVVALDPEGDLGAERLESIRTALSRASASDDDPESTPADRWEVGDIWSDSCVAPIVNFTWRLLDALEVPESARIDFSLHGPRSGRWSRRLRGEG